MIENATGIILRTFRYSETSLIVDWLCAEQGRISTIAKGALRPRSSFAGKLDLFYLANLSFSRSTRSELHTLRELSLVRQHPRLRTELQYLEQACYCAALVRQATEADSPIPEIYRIMKDFLSFLEAHPPQPRAVFAFELKLLNELGLSPDLPNSSLSAAARGLVEQLISVPWEEIAGLKATKEQALEIRRFLHGYIIFHLGRLPEGRAQAVH
jgi:DNA repair protein RecO (recombination protein O)